MSAEYRIIQTGDAFGNGKIRSFVEKRKRRHGLKQHLLRKGIALRHIVIAFHVRSGGSGGAYVRIIKSG